jgi:hypothetical protein
MDGLPAMHVNTMLLILISALYADARLCRASPARTKRQGRERRGRTQNENGLSQIATPSMSGRGVWLIGSSTFACHGARCGPAWHGSYSWGASGATKPSKFPW